MFFQTTIKEMEENYKTERMKLEEEYDNLMRQIDINIENELDNKI